MNKSGIVTVIFWCLLCQQNLMAQISISSNSFINKLIPNGAINEAGMDFQKELEFSKDEIVMSVAIFPQNLDNVIYNSWQIHVSKNNLDWDETLELYIRRTGEGKSDYNTKPLNGDYYQKIESYNNFFFAGQGWISSIPIQLKLSGFSVTLPAKAYATDIIFTLIDN
jgi:hypothetical protein